MQKSSRKGLYRCAVHGGGEYGDSGNPAGQNVGDTWLDTKLKDPVFAVDGKRWGSRYTDAQGDLYGQLSHTHALGEHPTKRSVEPPETLFLTDAAAQREGRHAGDRRPARPCTRHAGCRRRDVVRRA